MYGDIFGYPCLEVSICRKSAMESRLRVQSICLPFRRGVILFDRSVCSSQIPPDPSIQSKTSLEIWCQDTGNERSGHLRGGIPVDPTSEMHARDLACR